MGTTMTMLDTLGRGVPLAVLARAEIGLRKDFLETQDLHTLAGSFLDVRDVRVDHPVAQFERLHRAVALESHLDQATLDFGHQTPL